MIKNIDVNMLLIQNLVYFYFSDVDKESSLTTSHKLFLCQKKEPGRFCFFLNNCALNNVIDHN